MDDRTRPPSQPPADRETRGAFTWRRMTSAQVRVLGIVAAAFLLVAILGWFA